MVLYQYTDIGIALCLTHGGHLALLWHLTLPQKEVVERISPGNCISKHEVSIPEPGTSSAEPKGSRWSCSRGMLLLTSPDSFFFSKGQGTKEVALRPS